MCDRAFFELLSPARHKAFIRMEIGMLCCGGWSAVPDFVCNNTARDGEVLNGRGKCEFYGD